MTDRRVLLDTGPLVALLASSDSQHATCVTVFADLAAPLLTCWPVLTEAAWILRHQRRAAERLAEARGAGLFELLHLDGDSLDAIASIMTRYEDAAIQFADAALIHLAERENIRAVFTLDRRDFSIVRLKRGRSLRLLPEQWP